MIDNVVSRAFLALAETQELQGRIKQLEAKADPFLVQATKLRQEFKDSRRTFGTIWHKSGIAGAKQRRIKMLELRREGHSYNWIGKQYGVSGTRASQLIFAEERERGQREQSVTNL